MMLDVDDRQEAIVKFFQSKSVECGPASEDVAVLSPGTPRNQRVREDVSLLYLVLMGIHRDNGTCLKVLIVPKDTFSFDY